ncbi:MAG: cupin domain-containing protein [Ferruginibacter sp.]
METGKVVSVNNADHYIWGQNNHGWHLLKNDELSVIEERMNPDSSEHLHYHEQAQQLFYILSGEATFKLEEKEIHLAAGETMHVPPGLPHKISNNGAAYLRFLVISTPESHGDRIEVNAV